MTTANIRSRYFGQRIGPEKRAQVADLIRAGKYNCDIQRELDISSATVFDVARAFGLKIARMPESVKAARRAAAREVTAKMSTDAERHWRGHAANLRWFNQW
jgi:FixJ family two-component response regulator